MESNSGQLNIADYTAMRDESVCSVLTLVNLVDIDQNGQVV